MTDKWTDINIKTFYRAIFKSDFSIELSNMIKRGAKVIRNSIENSPGAEEILENITQCVIVTDLNGVVRYWNRASERIFGYSKEEMLDQPIKKVYPFVVEEQFQEDLNLLKKGKEIKGQWKSITKDGSIIWVDVHAIPVKNEEGELVSVVATAHNIQDLKETEKKLEENKAQAQAILETTLDGIITIDEEGVIKSFNRAASGIFGYSEEEVIGNNLTVLISKPHNEKISDFIERIIGHRQELTGKRKDGSLFPMELSVSEVQWNHSRIFTGVVNDISERRRLEKEILRISEEERRNLGQDLHDGLGQMLTGISLISQNLARKLKADNIPGSEKVEEISNLIKEADEYAKALAHGLVHVDFKEEGLQAALSQLCNQAEKFFNVNCTFEYDSVPKIDNNMKAMNLYRIAQEAISNAVKHGKADNVYISLTTQNGVIKLTITDDGIGFNKSTKNNNKQKKGMGIYIMKYRANMMSGNLEIFETDNKTNIVCSIPNNP